MSTAKKVAIADVTVQALKPLPPMCTHVGVQHWPLMPRPAK